MKLLPHLLLSVLAAACPLAAADSYDIVVYGGSSGGITANEPMACGAVADLDGDGHVDVVTAGSNLRIWRGLGNGQFIAQQSQVLSVGANDCTLGDLNRDGRVTPQEIEGSQERLQAMGGNYDFNHDGRTSDEARQ